MSPELARRVEALTAQRIPFVSAIVVRAQDPTSVRAGDTAIVLGDGSMEGFVGGACAESSVRLQALRVLETGEPLLLRIVPDEDDTEGAAAEGALVVANPCLSGGALEIFLEPRLPAPRITVVGEPRSAWRSPRWGITSDSRWRSARATGSPTMPRWWWPHTAAPRRARSPPRFRPASPTSDWSPAASAVPRCSTPCAPTACPRSSSSACARPPDSTSARSRRRRSRCRSSRRSWPRDASRPRSRRPRGPRPSIRCAA